MTVWYMTSVINRRSDEDVEGVEKAIASLPKARPYVIRDRTITMLSTEPVQYGQAPFEIGANECVHNR